MDYFECICLTCESKQQIRFAVKPYPEYGDQFSSYCKVCEKDTVFTRVLTKKTLKEIRRKQAELDLRNTIIERCDFYGFRCRFLYQSVIVTTTLSDWCFDYHHPQVTLYHESTTKINFETGDYAKAHVQFRNRSITPTKVIDYIAAHDEWRAKQNQLKKRKP